MIGSVINLTIGKLLPHSSEKKIIRRYLTNTNIFGDSSLSQKVSDDVVICCLGFNLVEIWEICEQSKIVWIYTSTEYGLGFLPTSFIYFDSVMHSGGQRVRLDIQKLSQFSIFPGQVYNYKKKSIHKKISFYNYKMTSHYYLQVVGVEGHNPSGHCLIASKIIDCLPLPVSADENSNTAKKQAVDHKFQPTDPSNKLSELSLVCKLVCTSLNQIQVEDKKFGLLYCPHVHIAKS